LARATSIPIIASGGLAGVDDLVGLAAVESDGVIGAISGRALYDGRLDAAQALAMDGVI
jgi:phosphoribosylformimino-5-aminoimidazole carboxamide ribotide isomerase